MVEIAIVDDERVLVNSLRIGLSKKGYRVSPFYDGRSFLQYLRSSEPDVVFLDLRLPDLDGLEVLAEITRGNKDIPTIIITAHGDVRSAVQSMKMGAFDYINKPFEIDEIELLVRRAVEEVRRLEEIEHHRRRSYLRVSLENIIGESPAIAALKDKVKRLSTIDATTVFIRGESGTGKDLVAKAIHNLSGRGKGPFLEVNCAALPETLLESELFGYEKGAFTDAKERKRGLAELADGGTLFLDEVGELPLTLQAKVLKFIESRAFRRIGGAAEISVDLSIIASTNRDMEVAIANGRFRRDLYYRLNVIPISVPPLRERGGDVTSIAEYWIEHCCRKFAKCPIHFDDGVREAFLGYDWPGNVRELKNLIERLVILSGDTVIRYEDLPEEIRERAVPERPRGTGRNLDQILFEVEEGLIRDALKKARGVKSEAAKLLGISRYALLRKMQRLRMTDLF